MKLYVYTVGKKIVGKGFNLPSSGYSSHEVDVSDFNRIDSELIDTGLYLYSSDGLTEDTEVRRMLMSAEVRIQRNTLLDACDWTQLSDAPLSPEDKAAWAEYRQALRDIPQQESFPFSVKFPEQP